ncbi:MAG: TerB N-terminal domain-containing protein [Clostridia bacterium]|nr:TerB N-terminal domain-containing protein [Clostridia bacterium]
MQDKKDVNGQETKDDFWDIDLLLPKKRPIPRRAPGATDTTEISFGGTSEPHLPVDDPNEVGDVPLNLNPTEGEVIVRHSVPTEDYGAGMHLPPVREKPVIEYENEKSLIHRVAVYAWSNQYRYYRDFYADATRYFAFEPQDGDPVAPVPFFSYVPQYSQMNDKQRAFYFYWRREFRRGNALEADESYLYLYAYEIINTAGHELPPRDGLALLYRLLRSYGTKYPRIFHSLGEWIVDYSLIFRLSVPEQERNDPSFWRLYSSALKEFYIAPPGGKAEGYTDLLIRFCSAYDYRKSHFYKGGNCAYFDRFLPGALSAVITQYSSGTHLFSGTGMRDSHMVRNAFEQALCSYRVRYRIEVDYASFSRSHEMRFLVSDVLKYTENRLRAFLGIKSRLTAYSLSTEVRNCIDRYCDENFPHKAPTPVRKKEEVPSYEKLYDLPKTPLSLRSAAEIERSSWETTRRLTEAFSDAPEDASDEVMTEEPAVPEQEPHAAVPETSSAPVSENASVLPALFGAYYPFVMAAYHGDFAAQARFCAERGMLPDLCADHINEIAADALGDILLEEDDLGYRMIEDYTAMFASEDATS